MIEDDTLQHLSIKDEFLAAVLRGEEYLLQDGAMGTQLLARGLLAAGTAPDMLNLENPDVVRAIHADYVEAGALMVSTNTFGSNARKLRGRVTVSEMYKAAIALAREAGARYVGADIGPLGLMLEPHGETLFNEAKGMFAEQVKAACDGGADIIVIETMSDLKEMEAAVMAAKENCSLPIFASMSFEANGRTFMGVEVGMAAKTLDSLGVQMIGANCSQGPHGFLSVIETLAAHTSRPVGARPNAGLPRVENGQDIYDIEPDEFCNAMASIIDAGATVIGGCCGTDPSFIRALKPLIEGRKPVSPFLSPR